MQKRIPLVLGFGVTGQSIIKYLSKKHNENKGAKATRGYKWELVYKKGFKYKSSALSYEYKLKKDRLRRLSLIGIYEKKKY